ncbi:MAG: alpha/beta hydrolase [Sphingomonas adhaesiva]|uniref:alpha/beta hydrolase n=1 Tax=Sphingomonas adhaesiva TaxID=28212 RepID=UPI002FF45B07
MTSRHLVDPELLPLLETWPTMTLTADLLPLARGREIPRPPVPPTDVSRERVEVPGRDGAPDVGMDVYLPGDARGPVGCIYHIHGGGYVLGAAAEMEFFLRPMAQELGCAIVSVDYRLAPETVHPGPLEDCYAGLAWTFANAARLGVDPARIGVLGQSAGGGLAAGLALLARDRGVYALAFQHLVYPMIDDRTCTGAPHPQAGEFIWNRGSNRFGWASLLGQEPGGADVSPYAAAARATDLVGLPPTYIMTGALDLFVEEDIDYARRLIAAGVPTELQVYPGAFHGFDASPDAAVAKRARADRNAALARALT